MTQIAQKTGLAPMRTATIRAMRELNDESKLTVRSLPEVFERVTDVVTRLKAMKSIRVFFKGDLKAPTKAAVVNAVLLSWLAMPRDERLRFLADGMAELNRLLMLPDPEGEAESGGGEAPGVVEPTEVTDERPGKRRGGKSA